VKTAEPNHCCDQPNSVILDILNTYHEWDINAQRGDCASNCDGGDSQRHEIGDGPNTRFFSRSALASLEVEGEVEEMPGHSQYEAPSVHLKIYSHVKRH
jgi:hypothetical protein